MDWIVLDNVLGRLHHGMTRCSTNRACRVGHSDGSIAKWIRLALAENRESQSVLVVHEYYQHRTLLECWYQ